MMVLAVTGLAQAAFGHRPPLEDDSSRLYPRLMVRLAVLAGLGSVAMVCAILLLTIGDERQIPALVFLTVLCVASALVVTLSLVAGLLEYALGRGDQNHQRENL